MNEHESYVSLETAKMLKDAGFDWTCTRYYQNNEDTLYGPLVEQYKLVETDFNVAPVYMSQYSAPTLDVAQRWLREVKHCFVNVNIDVNDNECEDTIVVDQFTCKYIIEGFPYCNNSPGDDYIRNAYGDNKYFNLYEEALEAGIKKCLTLLLENNE